MNEVKTIDIFDTEKNRNIFEKISLEKNEKLKQIMNTMYKQLYFDS
jgi:hypothetical protein